MFIISAQFDRLSGHIVLGAFSTHLLARKAIEIMVKRSLTGDTWCSGGAYTDEDEYRNCFDIKELPEIDNLDIFKNGNLVY